MSPLSSTDRDPLHQTTGVYLLPPLLPHGCYKLFLKKPQGRGEGKEGGGEERKEEGGEGGKKREGEEGEEKFSI